MIQYPTGNWGTDMKIPGSFVRDFSLYFEEIWGESNSVREEMYERLFIVWLVAKEASALEGDFVECGVFSGCSAWFMSRHKTGKLHLFDSWEGVTDFTEYDNDYYRENPFVISVESVRTTMADVEDVEIHIGEVPFEFDQVEQISFLHIDLDNYNPTKIAIEGLWDKVVPGGLVMVDFHDSVASGAEKATRDFFEGLRDITLFPTGKALIIK